MDKSVCLFILSSVYVSIDEHVHIRPCTQTTLYTKTEWRQCRSLAPPELISLRARKGWDLMICNGQSPKNLNSPLCRQGEECWLWQLGTACTEGKSIPGPCSRASGARCLFSPVIAGLALGVINWHEIIQPFFILWPTVWMGDLL